MPRKDLIAVRRGTAAEWTAANPVLAAGEPGLETDTGIFKVGDGQTPWLSLNDVRGVIAHDWGRDGWAPFQPVVITAHGSQQFDLDVDAGRGVVTGPGPEGSHRVALLR